MVSLKGKVALVTGASRGVGKGIALGLGEAGVTVYVTGRTTQEGTDIDKLGGNIFTTAEEATAMGGKGIAVACDHREDSDRKSTRLNSSHSQISYAVFCLKKKNL